MPTGSGKTAVGYTVLKTLANAGLGPLFYIAPTKAIVDQVKTLHPDVTAVYGRNEYDCLYYEDESFRADEIPCLSLDCAHRVDQETGRTQEPGVPRCPYYHAKYEAKQSPIVVCTAAYYLFTHLFSPNAATPAGLVIDEAHKVAETFRTALSFEITDWHVGRCVQLLRQLGSHELAGQMDTFLKALVKIVRRHHRRRSPRDRLLDDAELLELVDKLEQIEVSKLRTIIRQAVGSGAIDPVEDRAVLKQLETITHTFPRYARSLEYAMEMSDRKALNYVTYAASEDPEEERVKYRLIIKASYVAPLVKKLLSPLTVAYSATIGDPTGFSYETGISSKFVSLPGQFPAENALVLLPSDTPNLSFKARSKHEPAKVLRKVAKACGRFSQAGQRSLVVVVSNHERERFLRMCSEESVDAISYGNGVPPREAVARFRDGEGTVLVGTVANYGEGIDLPDGLASTAFFLRPGYPNPNDPRTQFERRRYGRSVWAIWNWRVMIEALQVRGRNVRSVEDRGVTFFVSQQFERFLYQSLPEWLRQSYVRDLTLEEGEEQALELLG